jgi:hypothetical protein
MEPGFIGFFAEKARQNNAASLCDPRCATSIQPASRLRPFEADRQALRQVGAFADLPRGVIVLMGQTHLLERLEEPVQILRQELPAKNWIDPCPNKFILGNRVIHRALVRQIQLEILRASVCCKVTCRRET